MITPFTPRRLVALSAALAAVAAVAAACGDDTDVVSDAACDRYADLQVAFFGDPAELVPTAEAFAGAVPDSLAADAGVLVDAFGSEDPAVGATPEFVAASERIGDAVFADCATSAAFDVDGIDYAFDGLPDTVEAGRIAFRLRNASESAQPHEVLVVAGADGQSADELRELPMEELMQQARPVGVAFVDTPGASSTTLVDLGPGSYLVLCTLPVAPGGDAGGGAGPLDSHADHGMVATLTVV